MKTALLERDQRLRSLASIVEFSDDVIVSKNLDGIITSWNKAAERIFGCHLDHGVSFETVSDGGDCTQRRVALS